MILVRNADGAPIQTKTHLGVPFVSPVGAAWIELDPLGRQSIKLSVRAEVLGSPLLVEAHKLKAFE